MYHGKEIRESSMTQAVGNTYVDASEAQLSSPEVLGDDIRVNFTGVLYISPDPNPLVPERHFCQGDIVFKGVQEYRLEISPPNLNAEGSAAPIKQTTVDRTDGFAKSLYPLKHLYSQFLDEAGRRCDLMTYVRCESIVLSGRLAATDKQYLSVGPDHLVTCDLADLDKIPD